MEKLKEEENQVKDDCFDEISFTAVDEIRFYIKKRMKNSSMTKNKFEMVKYGEKKLSYEILESMTLKIFLKWRSLTLINFQDLN